MNNATNSYLKEKSIQTENGEIFYYSDMAFQNKLTVVFLHGLSSNHTTWINAIETLHKNGYNSIALDLRGHGHSDKNKIKSLYKIPVFTDDLNRIVKNENINRFFLVGYSFGGAIAIDYAIKYSNSILGLVLISANHVNPLEYKKIKFLTPIGYAILNFFAFLLLWQKRKKYYYFQQGESGGYWHSVWVGLNTMPLSINFWMLSQMGGLNFRENIANIKAPTIIIRANDDPFLSAAEAEEMSKAILNARIIIPKHSSHFLASHAQEEVAQIILEFLKHYEPR